MPDDVRDMLGLPTQKEAERQKRSRSESRSPRGSARTARPKTLLTPKHKKVSSSSQQDLRPAPSLSEKFAQQDKRNQLSVFLGKTKETPGGQTSPRKQSGDGGDVPPDNPPPPSDPPKKLNMADIIIAAAAAKTVKLKTQGEENISTMLVNISFVEEVPPPTKNDEAERLVRRMILQTQRGEWDLAVENLKVKPYKFPHDPLTYCIGRHWR